MCFLAQIKQHYEAQIRNPSFTTQFSYKNPT